METLFKSFKKGDFLPANHPFDTGIQLSKAIFGADVDITQDKMELTIRPRKPLVKDDCLIRAETHDEIPEWVKTVTLWNIPLGEE